MKRGRPGSAWRTWDVATASRAPRQTVHDHDDDDAGAQARSLTSTQFDSLDSYDNTNQDTTVCLSMSDVLPCWRVSERRDAIWPNQMSVSDCLLGRGIRRLRLLLQLRGPGRRSGVMRAGRVSWHAERAVFPPRAD